MVWHNINIFFSKQDSNRFNNDCTPITEDILLKQEITVAEREKLSNR